MPDPCLILINQMHLFQPKYAKPIALIDQIRQITYRNLTAFFLLLSNLFGFHHYVKGNLSHLLNAHNNYMRV